MISSNKKKLFFTFLKPILHSRGSGVGYKAAAVSIDNKFLMAQYQTFQIRAKDKRLKQNKKAIAFHSGASLYKN